MYYRLNDIFYSAGYLLYIFEFLNLPRKYGMEISMLLWLFYGVGAKGKVRKKKGKEEKMEKRYK